MSAVKLSEFKEFPACDVLGYSLDFTTSGSTDIKSVGISNGLLVDNADAHVTLPLRSSPPLGEAAESSGTILMKTQENLK